MVDDVDEVIVISNRFLDLDEEALLEALNKALERLDELEEERGIELPGTGRLIDANGTTIYGVEISAAGVPRRLNDGRFEREGEMPLPLYFVIEGANGKTVKIRIQIGPASPH